ncbi:MAG: asparagine synthase (glutamine-hydrolyzing) [Bacteroidetes bacterium]|nr:asparagine synthase (glutamine-hydrolyzing) [Bacteroidota bacterium]
MCGILGYIGRTEPINAGVFDIMRDSMSHRGPDDAASHFLSEGLIALGHRRLSFLDLTPAGRQPMSNEDGTIWIVLNGEIYNYIELRQELLTHGHRFKTQSDTEVIVHGYEQWGLAVLQRLKGMFALGLVDTNTQKVFLVRDRFGIKPLYYRCDDRGLVFASELKGILADPQSKRDIDFSSFADYFVYRYVPSPKTIWKGIYKVPPAHYLEYDIYSGEISVREYWTIAFGHQKASERELVQTFGRDLERSVCMHARSDVPVGSFLSGGYDSSAVVYYLKKGGFDPKTFTIGFDGWGQSEDRYARLVADRLDVRLSATIADSSSLDLLDIMPDVYDEPIADISIIPTWLVSRLARTKVKAVMSGEGADELLGGYTWQKEFFAQQHIPWWQKIKRHMSGGEVSAVDYYAQAMAMGRFDRAELISMFSDSYHKHIPTDTEWFYRQHYDRYLSPLQSIQKMDIKCFMSELVLTKIDRASMANSLEVRVPFLDHEIFGQVLSTDERIYFKRDTNKFLLYENIKAAMPVEILQRKKQGFVGPDTYYMDMDWYQKVLNNSMMVRDGIIRLGYYQKLVTQKDHWRLWKMAVMEKWYRRWAT